MDRLGVQAKTNKKAGVKKKKPVVKVVYIANPKMVRTSASDFRALVQELTGNASTKRPTPSAAMESSPDLHRSDPQLSEGSDVDRYSPQISETNGYDDGDLLRHDLVEGNMEAIFEQFMLEYDFSIVSFDDFFPHNMPEL